MKLHDVYGARLILWISLPMAVSIAVSVPAPAAPPDTAESQPSTAPNATDAPEVVRAAQVEPAPDTGQAEPEPTDPAAPAAESTDAPSKPSEPSQAQEEPGSATAPAESDAPPDPNEFADLSLEQLMDVVVVTAGRREQKAAGVPHAISVITAEDIRRSGARSIPDALRLAPGVDVAQLHYGNAAVSVRGLHSFFSASTLVLVDGRQIYDAGFGGTLWGSWPFMLEDIERIEVVRGPGGVFWGADAVNGVINIITKDPADQQGLTLSLLGGSRGTHKEYLGYGGTDGKMRYRVSAEFEMSDGFRKGGNRISPLDDGYLAGRISGMAVYDKSETERLTFSFGSAGVDGGFPTAPSSRLMRKDPDTQANYIMGRWDREEPGGQSTSLAMYVNDFALDAGTRTFDWRYQQLGVLLNRTLPIGEKHTLTFGSDGRFDYFDASRADPQLLSRNHLSTGRIGLFLQDEWQFAPRWILNAGARIDYDAYGGFEPSARLSLGYEVNDHSYVYGAFSRAFQMPSAPLRFLETPQLGGLAFVTGTRSVDASTLLAYELGYRTRIGKRFDTNLALYWHETDDAALLKPRLGPPGLFRLHLDNGLDLSAYGFEWEGKFRATDRLTLLGNYTYERSNWRSRLPTHLSGDVISSPEHKFMLGALYNATDDFRLSSYLYYVDDVKSPNPRNPIVARTADAYFRLDLRAEHDLWDDTASLAVGVRNALDGNHFEGADTFFNDAEVPRMVYAEFRLRIP